MFAYCLLPPGAARGVHDAGRQVWLTPAAAWTAARRQRSLKRVVVCVVTTDATELRVHDASSYVLRRRAPILGVLH